MNIPRPSNSCSYGLIALMLTIFAADLFAVVPPNVSSISQQSWRWRNDDGNEVTATSRAADTTEFSMGAGTKQSIRLRISFAVFNKNTTNEEATFGQLQYTTSIIAGASRSSSTKDSLSWVTIPLTATKEAFELVASPNVANNTVTTKQLKLPPSYNEKGAVIPQRFVPGYLTSSPSNALPISFSPAKPDTQQITEVEFCIRSTAHCLVGTYFFRLRTKLGTTAYSYYHSGFPMITVGSIKGDIDGNGVINSEDLNIIISNFGKTAAP